MDSNNTTKTLLNFIKRHLLLIGGLILIYTLILLAVITDDKYHYLYQPKTNKICKVLKVDGREGVWCHENDIV